MDKIRMTFQNVQESYKVNEDIAIEYVISESQLVYSRDWIGLFKIGWTTHSDFYSYQWAPHPSGFVEGSEITNKVVFPASQLPPNDGCFYQFCYVTTNGQMIGVSPSFQFEDEIIEDLVEVDSEDGVIVKTKTMLLENKLEESQKNNASLKLKLNAMEEECKRLRMQRECMEKKVMECVKKVDDFEDVDKKFSDNCKYITHLEEELSVLRKENNAFKSGVRTSNDKMVLIMEKFQDQKIILEQLNKTNNDLLKRNEQLEKEFSRLKELGDAQAKENKLLKKQRAIADSQISAAELTKDLLKQEFEKEMTRIEELVNENLQLRTELQFFENSDKNGKCQRRIDIHLKAKSKSDDKSFFDMFRN